MEINLYCNKHRLPKQKINTKITARDIIKFRGKVYLAYSDKKGHLVKLMSWEKGFVNFEMETCDKNRKIRRFRRKIVPKKYRLELTEMKI